MHTFCDKIQGVPQSVIDVTFVDQKLRFSTVRYPRKSWINIKTFVQNKHVNILKKQKNNSVHTQPQPSVPISHPPSVFPRANTGFFLGGGEG